jgi:nitrogen-specific signal transduction histidine kinase
MSVSELQNLQPNSNDSAADLHLTIARQVIEKHGGMLNTQLKHSDCIVLQIQLPLLS